MELVSQMKTLPSRCDVCGELVKGSLEHIRKCAQREGVQYLERQRYDLGGVYAGMLSRMMDDEQCVDYYLNRHRDFLHHLAYCANVVDKAVTHLAGDPGGQFPIRFANVPPWRQQVCMLVNAFSAMNLQLIWSEDGQSFIARLPHSMSVCRDLGQFKEAPPLPRELNVNDWKR